MPTARLRLDRAATDSFWVDNGAVPGAVRTTSGVFLVEIQGTIQVGKQPLISSDLELTIKDDDDDDDEEGVAEADAGPVGAAERQLGYFDFSTADANSEVTLVIGKHQRLRGKIAKVSPPMALIELEKGVDEPQPSTSSQSQRYQPGHDESAELDIPVLEIITHKIVFDSRPEPVT
jgi:hypothetical protein